MQPDECRHLMVVRSSLSPHERCNRREENNEFQINRSCGAVIRNWRATRIGRQRKIRRARSRDAGAARTLACARHLVRLLLLVFVCWSATRSCARESDTNVHSCVVRGAWRVEREGAAIVETDAPRIVRRRRGATVVAQTRHGPRINADSDTADQRRL